MKTVIKPLQESAADISGRILEIIKNKKKVNIAFSADPCVYEVIKALNNLVKRQKPDMSNVTVFGVQEYCDTGTQYSLNEKIKSIITFSYAGYTGITEENVSEYDSIIADNGGIDVIVLGLGSNSTFGFNEPGTQFSSKSHKQKLTRLTRTDRKNDFSTGEHVPEFGLTMGIKTVVNIPCIYVIVSGTDKEDALFDMLYARDDSVVPSAFLQIPANVYVYADEAASGKL